MGCFSITGQKARKKMMDQCHVPEPRPASFYDNKPTLLPHPYEVEQGTYTRTLSAPPKFTDRGRSQSSISTSNYKEYRALSAPSRVRMLDSYAHSGSPMANMRPPSSPLSNRILPLSDPAVCQNIDKKAFGGCPLPLPIPLPATGHPLPIPEANDPSSSVCETTSYNLTSGFSALPSFKCSTPSREGNGKLVESPRASSSLRPKPLPQPPGETNSLASSPRVFSRNELAAACQNFSSECCIGDIGVALVYRSWIFSEGNSKNKTEVSVMQINSTSMLQDSDSRDFTMEATKLSSVRHPHLCKLIGFCIEDTSQLKADLSKSKACFLVYEYLPNGTADKLLYGREAGAPLDWSTRVKIALGAAKGLAYLHKYSSRQISYREFSTFNIQIDLDYNAKLTGYGFFKSCPSELFPITAYTAPETAANGVVTCKSNVWSFGVVLLELLTGRQNLDAVFPEEEQDLVQWSKRFAVDDSRLFLGMDPELKGCYPAPHVKLLADLALTCLHEEPDLRPSMKEVVEILASLKRQSSTRERGSPDADIMDYAGKHRSLEQALVETNPQARFSGYFSSIGTTLTAVPQRDILYLSEKIAWPSRSTNNSAYGLESPKIEVRQQIHVAQST
ncbi:hypothetical protein O6H91_16G076500 [Diphasiastrum complanatum]|uniref:Uncharacterized protein n=8 Tax=Diphasiastrum complanatum TaxID=34168 RepID=A0ACC2BDV1_DIPCM|nr:hypothetical protein O6H91_16G076500 [Diphasiastrum complanatum]KAJ7527928.1 hypothetical protein O6H91_16G076500 [Diphasiastrum complanatum]KAJ7527929.1 hypothetical protein O6H91_16G076500 [Diphasiastrum complanatum]KAJ7527930.1 hypothetical protein O6H91_16G076500 [Diphasiastrum complanatum]KAJ7527931.1 hypothetical protein O6H91_16G076500 [Diphasiastrum complanatum]